MTIEWDRRVRASVINICVATLFTIAAYMYGLDHGFHRVVPDPIESHNAKIAAALSDLGYGSNLKGAAYTKVFDALRRGGMSFYPEYLDPLGTKFPDNIFDAELQDRAIANALGLLDVDPAASRIKTDIVLAVPFDLGQYVFYKLAFRLFGFEISSFYYMYFAVFGLSVAVMALSFRRDPAATLTLAVACAAHALMLKYIIAVGGVQGVYHLAAPHNNRFLSALAIVPTLHLLWAFLRRPTPTADSIAGTIAQTGLLMFAALVRISAMWGVTLLLALAAWRFVRLTFALIRKGPAVDVHMGNRLRATFSWPIAVVVTGLILQQGYERLAFHPLYQVLDEYLPTHLVWHGTYQGLRLHPKWQSRFAEDHMVNGALPGPDEVPVVAVQNYLGRFGIDPSYVNSPLGGLRYRTYERVLSHVYLGFVAAHPWYMVQLTAWYKPRLFAEIYGQTMWPVVKSVPIVLAIGGAILLAACAVISRRAAGESWAADIRRGVKIAGAMFAASMVPILISAPGGYTCGDQIWTLNILLGMGILWVISMAAAPSRERALAS